jgi:hypothetical protein
VGSVWFLEILDGNYSLGSVAIIWQLTNGKESWTVSLQGPVGGAVHRSGWAGSGELIIDPPQFELGLFQWAGS